jgi:acyl-CoA reductase-like NAD-dependent aldehyde dehydrogenase
VIETVSLAGPDEFAQVESRQAGKPIRLTREFDVPGTIDNVDFFSGASRNLEGKATAEYSADRTSSIRREPSGVFGSISPWARDGPPAPPCSATPSWSPVAPGGRDRR